MEDEILYKLYLFSQKYKGNGYIATSCMAKSLDNEEFKNFFDIMFDTSYILKSEMKIRLDDGTASMEDFSIIKYTQRKWSLHDSFVFSNVRKMVKIEKTLEHEERAFVVDESFGELVVLDEIVFRSVSGYMFSVEKTMEIHDDKVNENE